VGGQAIVFSFSSSSCSPARAWCASSPPTPAPKTASPGLQAMR